MLDETTLTKDSWKSNHQFVNSLIFSSIKFYHVYLKYSDRQAWASSVAVEPDQIIVCHSSSKFLIHQQIVKFRAQLFKASLA